MHPGKNKIIIARIKGGLGNQLFCYAAARRLALVNGAELVIDDVTGFSRDSLYRRSYMLDNFSIQCRKATPAERMEPFEKYRRYLARRYNKILSFERRRYIEQKGIDFDRRLLNLKITSTVCLDGLWQGEGYFKDIEPIIRSDLKINYVPNSIQKALECDVEEKCSVAVHVRFFDNPGKVGSNHNLTREYYTRALSRLESLHEAPHFFVFSDRPDDAFRMVPFDHNRVTFVGGNSEICDLWLMGKCKHFIIANSTFSWWGAWLSEAPKKQIFYPDVQSLSGVQGWGFKGLIPDGWQGI